MRKFDYFRHPEAKKLVLEKTESHVPRWRKWEEGISELSSADIGGETECDFDNKRFEKNEAIQESYPSENKEVDFYEQPEVSHFPTQLS